MPKQLIHKIKHFVVSLRFSILSIFITLFVTTVLFLIVFVTLRFEELLEYTSFSLMNQVSLTVLEDVESELDPVRVQSEFSAKLIENNVFDPDQENEMVNYTLEVLQILPIIQGVVWGDEYGNYIVTYKEKDGTITTEFYNDKLNPPVHQIHRRDIHGKIIKKELIHTASFDPREHSWYIHAKQNKQSAWTDIIKLQFTSQLAVTVSTPVYNQDGSLRGVFGLGVTLDDLVNFMTKQRVSENGYAFIVTQEGKVIVLPKQNSKNTSKDENRIYDIHHLDNPVLALSLDQYNATGVNHFTMNYDGQSYLFSYRKIPTLSNYHWLIGVMVPQGDFTRTIEEITFITIMDCLIVLMICIFIVSKFITRIVKPIKMLAREAYRMRQFEFTSQLQIRSRIKEVINLVDAFNSLKQGLKSFQKYVPKSLVNQLIEAHEDTRVGGLRKQLIIFFSDIENFTSISEWMNPNELMIYLCEYLEEMSKIISDHHGTIDKYIGDAIMAFWGAPVIEERPEQFAAHAALKCQKRLLELNKRWMSEGRMPFVTRIGLHMGEAIVGNVGSSERLNYTAIGNTINIASRLEKLNKLYHTHIVVSEAVYETLKSTFVLRKIDSVMLRGRVHSLTIYELLAKDKSELSFDLVRYEVLFSDAYLLYQAGRFSEAIEAFYQCLNIYPNDVLAPVFIKRCTQFKDYPPVKWDGVWKILE